MQKQSTRNLMVLAKEVFVCVTEPVYKDPHIGAAFWWTPLQRRMSQEQCISEQFVRTCLTRLQSVGLAVSFLMTYYF